MLSVKPQVHQLGAAPRLLQKVNFCASRQTKKYEEKLSDFDRLQDATSSKCAASIITSLYYNSRKKSDPMSRELPPLSVTKRKPFCVLLCTIPSTMYNTGCRMLIFTSPSPLFPPPLQATQHACIILQLRRRRCPKHKSMCALLGCSKSENEVGLALSLEPTCLTSSSAQLLERKSLLLVLLFSQSTSSSSS